MKKKTVKHEDGGAAAARAYHAAVEGESGSQPPAGKTHSEHDDTWPNRDLVREQVDCKCSESVAENDLSMQQFNTARTLAPRPIYLLYEYVLPLLIAACGIFRRICV